MDTQVENIIIPFNFQGVSLRESCWIDGKPHFTIRTIGEFLEYAFPRQAIIKIIERNPYILEFRTVVNLTTVEGGRNVSRELEVFNPIGLQCIFFESHQPKAIQYKVAVAKLVWALVNGELKPSKWSQKGDLISAARQILSLPEGRKRRELIVDLAERENRSLQSTYRNIYKATGERLKTKAGTPRRNRSDKGSFRGRPEYRQALNYKMQHPEATAPEIRSKLGISVSASRINSWMRETIH